MKKTLRFLLLATSTFVAACGAPAANLPKTVFTTLETRPRRGLPTSGSAPISFLCAFVKILSVSVVKLLSKTFTTETRRSHRDTEKEPQLTWHGATSAAHIPSSPR